MKINKIKDFIEDKKMIEYVTSINLGDNKGARLAYLGRIMSITKMDYRTRKSTTFCRVGVDEKGLREDLLRASGVTKLIKNNRKEIEESLKYISLGTHKPFRECWGLAA